MHLALSLKPGVTLPFGIHETCPYSFTHGKYAWTSNMDSIKFNLYLCERVVINYQKREIESSSLVWLIDETLSANLVYLSDHEIGSIILSGEATMKIMMMVMPW